MKNNETIRVKPISVDYVHVIIICPFCRKKHYHGSCGGKNYAGLRVAHCAGIFDEYYIEALEEWDRKVRNEN